jgi:tetratricopeptide (TPR) repeat protein
MKMLLLIALFVAGTYAASDSAAILFQQGIAAYDSVLVKKALDRSFREEPQSGFLFKATCLWRIQIINYVAGDKKGMIAYGARSLDLLDSAKKRDEDPYLINARRANICGLLAGTGIKNGATYGPRTAKYLNEMRKIQPHGFDTRFTEAMNLLEMPLFVGGDPKKALEQLRELNRDYLDSAAVAITLARALVKNKQKEEAVKVLDRVLLNNPKDRWALKVEREIK